MQLKNNKSIKRAVVLIAVVALTGAIGVALSAQMGPRRGMEDGPGMMGGQGMRGEPGMMRGPGGPGGPGGRRGGPFGGPFGMLGPGLRALELTEAQRDQIRTAMDAHREAIETAGDNVMEARKALHDAVTAETMDEGAIRQKAAAVGAAEADAAVLHAKIHKEVFALLTAEQQQKAKALRSEMEQRMKDGRGRMRERLQGTQTKKRGGPEAV